MIKSRAQIVYEIYKIIQDNKLSNRRELEDFFRQDIEKYREHFDFILADTIWFQPQAVQDILGRLEKRLGIK